MSSQHNPVFDPVAHTQAGLPHLLQVLWDAYTEHLGERIERRRVAGQPNPTGTPQQLRNLAPTADFVGFATAYLTKHRVVENFFVDANHGIVLSNQARCVICPGIDVGGTMEESGAVGITEGRGQPHLHGVISHQGLEIK